MPDSNGPHARPNRAGRLAWLVWGAAGAFVFYQFVLQASTTVMEADLVRAFHLDKVGFGVISAEFYTTYLLLQIPAGVIVARYGPRRVMAIGLLLCAAATMLFGLAPSRSLAEAARILMGMGAAPAVVSALTLAARWFPPGKFALVAGLTEMLGAIGGAVGQEVLGAAVHRLGWRQAMLGDGLIGLALALAAWLVVRDRPPARDPFAPAEVRPRLRDALRGVGLLLTNAALWINGLITGLLFALATAFGLGWGVPFLELRLDVDLPAASFACSLLFWGSTLGLPVMGWLEHRLGRRKPIMGVGCVISMLLTGVLFYLPGLGYSSGCVVIFALGFIVSSYVMGFAAAPDLVEPSQHGPAMAFTNMMSLLIGGWFMQPLIGWFLDRRTGQPALEAHGKALDLAHYQEGLTLLPLGMAVALGLLLFLPETGWKASAPAEDK